MTIEELNARCSYNTRNGIWILDREPGRCTVEIRVTEEVAFGGGNFQIIAGPCSVESEDQVETIAKAVKESLSFILPSLDHGLKILRGSATECARK